MLTFLENFSALTWQMVVMWIIGGVLIFLAIKKEMEPSLLLPMGFGAILVNLPNSGAVEVLETLYNAGISNELFPLLLFIGIGAMIDFGPLLSNPKMLLFGAAAQFGIFFTLSAASLMGFDLHDAASIAIIGAADGPTSIVVANHFKTKYLGAIVVADRAALLHKADYHQGRTPDTHEVQSQFSIQDDAHTVPDTGNGNRGTGRARVGGADRLFDVRQSAARMRRA